MATHRAKKNKILSLDINGQQTTTKSDIKTHIFSFYKNLLGIPGDTTALLESDFWDTCDKLTDSEQHSLEVPFSLEEIK